MIKQSNRAAKVHFVNVLQPALVIEIKVKKKGGSLHLKIFYWAFQSLIQLTTAIID